MLGERISDDWAGLDKLPGLVGVVIIIGGLALGLKAWDASGSDGIWMFLNNALNPVALGVLIIAAAEIVLRLDRMKPKGRRR